MLDVMSGAGWSQATRLAPQWTRIMPIAGCRGPCVSVMPRHTSSPDAPGRQRRPFVFNGRHTNLRYANCWPKPMQTLHAPIWGRAERPGVHRCRQSQDRAPADGRAGTWLEHSDPLDWIVISALGRAVRKDDLRQSLSNLLSLHGLRHGNISDTLS